jgi:cytochrome o ubiquinol oxidase subunit II
MKKSYKFLIASLLLIAIIAASIVYIKSHNIPVLEPKGFIGVKEKDLIITASLLMLIVVIPVYIFAFYFSWKYKEGSNAKHTPDWEHNTIAEVCWWGVPFVIITCLAVITWKSSFELSPFKEIASDKKAVRIQAIALQYKWLFLYPDEGVATINYIKFPVNTPLKFEITADAPMNSFWIPQLGGQIYAMPAMRSSLNLIASETGSFRGLSANISGTGFAGMMFEAISTTADDYSSWISQARSQSSFSLNDYQNLVKVSENLPKSEYALGKKDLFDFILMKYMQPAQDFKTNRD